MKLVVVSDGLGCHPGGVCAAGEETQNRRTGSKRTRHHHRHQPEGEERKRTTNASHTRSAGSPASGPAPVKTLMMQNTVQKDRWIRSPS